MVQRHTKKNEFGKTTWEIKLSPLFHMFLKETNEGSFLVEIKEWIIISYKTRIKLISSKNFEFTIIDSLEKFQNYLNQHKKGHTFNSVNRHACFMRIIKEKAVFDQSLFKSENELSGIDNNHSFKGENRKKVEYDENLLDAFGTEDEVLYDASILEAFGSDDKKEDEKETEIEYEDNLLDAFGPDYNYEDEENEYGEFQYFYDKLREELSLSLDLDDLIENKMRLLRSQNLLTAKHWSDKSKIMKSNGLKKEARVFSEYAYILDKSNFNYIYDYNETLLQYDDSFSLFDLKLNNYKLILLIKETREMIENKKIILSKSGKEKLININENNFEFCEYVRSENYRSKLF